MGATEKQGLILVIAGIAVICTGYDLVGCVALGIGMAMFR